MLQNDCHARNRKLNTFFTIASLFWLKQGSKFVVNSWSRDQAMEQNNLLALLNNDKVQLLGCLKNNF